MKSPIFGFLVVLVATVLLSGCVSSQANKDEEKLDGETENRKKQHEECIQKARFQFQKTEPAATIQNCPEEPYFKWIECAENSDKARELIYKTLRAERQACDDLYQY